VRPSSFERCSFLFFTVAATGGALFVQSGSAAHAAPPAYAWNKCYIGAQAGAATSTSRWAYTDANPYSATGNVGPIVVPGANFNDTRGIIGLQGGCNYAVANWWLLGFEGAWFSNPMNEHNGRPGFFPDPTVFPPEKEVVTTNIQSVLSLTGRVGFAPSADWLLYAKGGGAAAKIQTSGTVTPAFDPPLFDFQTTGWHFGWTAGAGVEYRLFRNVTIGMEYDYYRFANVMHSGPVAAVDLATVPPTPANPVNHRVNADVQTLMARVNFAFDVGPTAVDSGPYAAYAAYVKAPPLAQPVGSFSAFSTSELKYSSWNGTRGANVFAPDPGKGYQYFSPTTIGIDYLEPSQYKLETRLRSGYVYSAQNTAGQLARYEGPVDTQASFNLTLLNFESIRPLLGLSLNLPTGNTYLPGNQRFTRMDPDLVDVGSYGVGFNVNPTAGFIFGLNENTAISLSAGYTWQGDFTKEGINLMQVANPTPPPATIVVSTFDLKQKVSPGNTYTANGNISSTYGRLVLIASFAYMGDSHASIDGMVTGRAGAKFTSNGTANYQIDDRWALSTNVSWNFAERNQIPNGLGGLIIEPKNSNSHVVIGSIEPSYMATERLRLAANYSFLYRDHNFYDMLEDQFIPAKQKQLAGGSATYFISPAATVTLRGSHAWVRQSDGPFLVTTLGPPPVFALQPPTLKYEVWAASLAATLRF
jgi:opacity protein-like surface antigen